MSAFPTQAWRRELARHIDAKPALKPVQLKAEEVFVQVWLQDRRRQAAMLAAWNAELKRLDATVGCSDYSDADRLVHLRCLGPGGMRVVVTAAWPTESPQIELAQRRVEQGAAGITAMLTELQELER